MAFSAGEVRWTGPTPRRRQDAVHLVLDSCSDRYRIVRLFDGDYKEVRLGYAILKPIVRVESLDANAER